MIRHSALVLAVAAVTSGCSSMEERRTANGDFGYAQQQQKQQALRTPPHLVAPKVGHQYALPENIDSQGKPAGKALRIDSPALVMPLASGSRVVEGSPEARVYFDQVDDDMSLNQTIWQAVISYLEDNQIEVAEFDREAGRLTTEWAAITDRYGAGDEGGWFGGDSEANTKQSAQLAFELDMKPHGRSGELRLSLLDYRSDQKQLNDLSHPEQQRLEVMELNRVLANYAEQQQIDRIKQVREAQKGLALELDKNQDGNAIFTVNTDYDIAWTRTQLVLRKLGFVVKDLDKSIGLLFVDYQGADESWWSSMFGSDSETLPLEHQAYRLKVTEQSDTISITLMNDASEPLDETTIDAVYPAFAEVMAQDDLDI